MVSGMVWVWSCWQGQRGTHLLVHVVLKSLLLPHAIIVVASMEEGAPSSQGSGTVALCKALNGLSLECQLGLQLKILHFG